ncbi:MAG: hypothetical protein NTW15_09750 [Burkholderiales bacterium]|nr:hypothetical protein [Burkholderiales bacterium]
MFLAQAQDVSRPTPGVMRAVRSIAQVPQAVRDNLKDPSDRTGQALIPPRRFTQAAELLTGRGARVDDGEDEYTQERAKVLRPAKPFGYDPELLAARRLRSLVELDAAFDRWRTLPSPKWVKEAVNELVARRKLEFASSAAEQDWAANLLAGVLSDTPYSDNRERSMRVWRNDRTPDQSTLVKIANPGNERFSTIYWGAWKKSNAAETRVRALSSLLRDQIMLGRVDWGALIREAPGLRWALRSAEKHILLRPLDWGQEP